MAFGHAVRAATAVLLTLLPVSIALAQTVADFYRGKSIDLYISSGVGGGNDLYARTVARHIGKHIPGHPTILPKNMEGAGGMRLANWLYNVGPKDGTVIGAVSRAMAFEPLLGNKTAQYDATKFNYIGSANDEVSVCVAWYTSGIKTFEDAQRMQLIVGATGIAERRLSERQRYQPGNGAWRIARPLHYSMVYYQGQPPFLDRRKKGEPVGAVLAQQAS
jgi:hypothetical protein